ncbi:AF4/FMR2 family member lilli isoform X2 [Procambarus clarkii]|uniref:AF4/FMR2 family member lilli isoform X2 n=1 Tax=Procambarus clarkii TaxID=6728 RepID=UPI001E675F26|nr:serine/threonine-protein kinase phg2-like isoform X2 [Procambarus clarkii]
MSVLNLSEDMVECPLCMEPLEMDDLNFFPCTCGYQICRFCWHRIRTDENGLCPACRKAYPENPADFKPLSHEDLQRIKQEKRQKDAQRKQKVTENRKHLANVRVVQKNLVFVVGLSTRLADAETLKKPEYFGKFGKIHKVVINHSTSYAGSQGPSASAYVTYQRAEDALRAIQAVNNIHVDGRTLKASLGTTKYCSHFMKNQQCPKPDCMYLHELGDESASFTKEEMQQGKHQEFEKKLQDQYLGNPTSEKNSTSVSPPQAATSGNSSSNKRTASGGGKENSAPKNQDSISPNPNSGEAWPSLNAIATKESKKSKGSKSDRSNGSARHTPTDEHNNNNNNSSNNNNKRGSKERDRSCNTSSSSSSNSSTSGSSSSSSNGLGVDMMNHSVSPVATSSPSSGHESCTSSASTTPPPSFDNPLIPPSPPPCSSSPVPVSCIQDLCREDTSPLPTPPSSLSSSSEPSSSLPLPQQFSRSAAAASLFSDNSNSFFSSGPSLPLQRTPPPLPPASSPQQNHQLHNSHASSHQYTHDNTSDWASKTSEVFDMDSMFPSQNRSNSTWNCIFDFEKSEDMTGVNNLVDDELGFDPFEETNKALAEDIKIEQKQQQQLQRHQQQFTQHQHHQHQSQLQSHHHQQQQQQLRAGLKSLMDYTTPSGQSRARLPPPGFNGLNSFNSYGMPRQTQPEPSKLLPPFLSGLAGNPNLGTPGLGSAPSVPPALNGLVGSSGLGVPPGLGGSLLGNGTTNGLGSGGIPGGLGNGMPPHLLSPASLLSMDTPLSASQGPPGIGLPKSDAFLLKDLENGLRNIFPAISSVSTMNTLNTVNTLNSLAGGTNNPTSQNNPLANFLNMAHHHHQQQQQHPSQQSLLHQLTMSSLASSHKGWSNSGAPDLTVLDPAIVSSGQLTDSRSDSPPHWMKTMEQLTEGGPHPLWNNLMPYNLSGLPTGLGPHTGPSGPTAPTQRSVAPMWPPTSPPPGFNSISPLHHPKQHEPHKIENL